MPPLILDRYDVQSGIGRGAMGSVYLAVDTKMGREVAVKVLQKEYAQDDKHRERFEREARAIAALKHPNIVDIYDYGGSPKDDMYLVMEYIEGNNLGKLVRTQGPLPETVLLAMGMELASGLKHAHSAGIIHRDLKPENVFLENSGRVVLVDFGIVKAVRESSPLGARAARQATDIIGTPGFMAPEQFEQRKLDARTDVFAWGALIYYLATKKLPYDAESPYGLVHVFRETRPTPLDERRPEISEELSRLIQECLEVDPDLRPKKMGLVWQRLSDMLTRSGAREPRDLLAEHQTAPEAFAAKDRERSVRILTEQLVAAVKDRDAHRCYSLRRRVLSLDPEKREALNQIRGLKRLLKRRARDTGVHRATRVRKRLSLAAGACGLVVLAWFGWFILGSSPEPPATASAPKPAPPILSVQSAKAASVFVNGRALGKTPISDVPTETGSTLVELIGPGKRLQHRLDLVSGWRYELTANWRRGRVEVEQVPEATTPQTEGLDPPR